MCENIEQLKIKLLKDGKIYLIDILDIDKHLKFICEKNKKDSDFLKFIW